MSNNADPVNNDLSTNSAQTPEAAASTTPGGSSASINPADFNMNAHVGNSIASLQQKAPAVWNLMCVSLAQVICQQMQDNQQKLKELQQQYQRDSQS